MPGEECLGRRNRTFYANRWVPSELEHSVISLLKFNIYNTKKDSQFDQNLILGDRFSD